MKQYLFFFISFFLLLIDTNAQVSYIEDSNVSRVMNQYISENKGTVYTLGYRVQILSSTDRHKMEKVKGEFAKKFPELIVIWTYEAPNYKLRVGAFRTKLETEQLKNKVRKEYPSSFPVKDNKIKPSEYL